MSTYISSNKDQTIFKTEDGRYINDEGCDISKYFSRLKKPQKFIPLTSQPKFWVITLSWDEELDQDIVNFIIGPYSTKEEAQEREGTSDYILLATEQTMNTLAINNGLRVE